MTVEEQIKAAERTLAPMFERIDKIALFNQEKVLKAFREERIALRHFVPTTGYGYGDEGRESLGKVYARAFGAERAVVSPSLLSGTHALTVALSSATFGLVFGSLLGGPVADFLIRRYRLIEGAFRVPPSE